MGDKWFMFQIHTHPPVTLGRLLELTEPPFLHLWNENINIFPLTSPDWCEDCALWRLLKHFWNTKCYKMTRSLWHYFKSSATRDVRGAHDKASGEMYNTGAFSKGTKAVPNYLLNRMEKKGPQSFLEASADSGLQHTVLERGWELSVLEDLNNWTVKEPRWTESMQMALSESRIKLSLPHIGKTSVKLKPGLPATKEFLGVLCWPSASTYIRDER